MSEIDDKILKFLQKTDTNIELETAMEEVPKEIPKFDNRKDAIDYIKDNYSQGGALEVIVTNKDLKKLFNIFAHDSTDIHDRLVTKIGNELEAMKNVDDMRKKRKKSRKP